jgi:hypothetical protein
MIIPAGNRSSVYGPDVARRGHLGQVGDKLIVETWMEQPAGILFARAFAF